MNILRRAGVVATLGAGLLAASMHAGGAAADNGAPYAAGGIGIDERSALEAARGEFNLRMTFASKRSGEYRADVGVEIRNAQAAGNPLVLKLDNTGPLLYAKLPPGRYEVKAQSDGQRQIRQVTLPQRGAHELYFYWDQ